MDPSRIIHQSVDLIHGDCAQGDLIMDTPNLSWEELKKFASNRDACRELVKAVRNGPAIHVDLTTRSVKMGIISVSRS